MLKVIYVIFVIINILLAFFLVKCQAEYKIEDDSRIVLDEVRKDTVQYMYVEKSYVDTLILKLNTRIKKMHNITDGKFCEAASDNNSYNISFSKEIEESDLKDIFFLKNEPLVENPISLEKVKNERGEFVRIEVFRITNILREIKK